MIQTFYDMKRFFWVKVLETPLNKTNVSFTNNYHFIWYSFLSSLPLSVGRPHLAQNCTASLQVLWVHMCIDLAVLNDIPEYDKLLTKSTGPKYITVKIWEESVPDLQSAAFNMEAFSMLLSSPLSFSSSCMLSQWNLVNNYNNYFIWETKDSKLGGSEKLKDQRRVVEERWL